MLPVDGRTLSRSSVTCTELGKPVSLLLYIAGKPIAREAEWGAGKGLRRKRTLPCNAGDRGLNVTSCESRQTSAG